MGGSPGDGTKRLNGRGDPGQRPARFQNLLRNFVATSPLMLTREFPLGGTPRLYSGANARGRKRLVVRSTASPGGGREGDPPRLPSPHSLRAERTPPYRPAPPASGSRPSSRCTCVAVQAPPRLVGIPLAPSSLAIALRPCPWPANSPTVLATLLAMSSAF